MHLIRTLLCVVLLSVDGLPRESHAMAGSPLVAPVQPEKRVTLPGSRPAWAKAANRREPLEGTKLLNRMNLVLKRSPERQAAFDKLLGEQQDPSSPNYRRWLSPAEIGELFGASDREIDAAMTWLRSQNLKVDALSPDRRRIRFSGQAAAVGAAFGAPLHVYETGSGKRIAPAHNTVLPAELATIVESVAGLESLRFEPLLMRPKVYQSHGSSGPAATFCREDGCEHLVFPADFVSIYNLGTPFMREVKGVGQNIAILARTRVHDDDMRNYVHMSESPSWYPLPEVIIPPSGVEPGPAETTCSANGQPSCSDPDETVLDQMEATLDVQRAIASGVAAKIKLISSASDDSSDGILIALEHVVDAEPPIAKIVSISYGTCEADNSEGAAAYLDALYSQAAMRGMSIFVASGDSGAADCSPHHEAPDGDVRRSINLLCASGHVTCVGGTQFTDENHPDAFWLPFNVFYGFRSALGYIPEGSWNEPLDADGALQVASGGGGVSEYIDTPEWQRAPGVPVGRVGRYVPDVSLNAAARTGYFTCMAALGGACTRDSEGTFRFLVGAGTSATAPSMAGIAALLNQHEGVDVGNLNPRLYQLASDPGNGVFHDVDLASSGVTGCNEAIPSPCNNSTPGTSSLAGGARGYRVGTGYDLATGIGSPDVELLLDQWSPATDEVVLNQRGLSGSWANAETNGQGILIDLAAGLYGAGPGVLFGGWFTYDTRAEGGQRWYTLQGMVDGVDPVHAGIYETTGGSLDSAQQTTTRHVGEATFSVDTCRRASLSFRFNDGRAGIIPLTRLLANQACTHPGSELPRSSYLYSGAWADPGNSGQGFVFEFNAKQNTFFAAWYTFLEGSIQGPAGQRWYTLQATLEPGVDELRDVGIFSTEGGIFNQGAQTATRQVGVADLVMHDCTSATLHYRFPDRPGGTLELRRVTEGPGGCD